jgi:hypothetical protein
MLAWSTVIPLLDGDNDIEILGFDSSGSLVDSTSIVITNEAPWEKPVIQMLEPDTAAIGERIAIRGTDFHDGLVVRFPPIVVTDVEFDEDADPGLIYVTVPDGLLGDLTPVEVENRDGQRSEPALLFIKPEGEEFIRGDANIDRVVDISDAVATLNYLFAGGPAFCIDALDSNDSGIVDLTDAVVTLSYLFQGGVAPRAPFPGPGVDPTDDTLDCERG